MRIAWFSPLPPERSGIAAYSAELLPLLADDHAIDAFVDRSGGGASSPGVLDAHDFVWKHRLTPYDLVVYQLGNAPCHDYMWAYLSHYPGLVVLHDARLHHARARQLLQQGRFDDYREEFRYDHPDAVQDFAEYAVEGLGGPIYYFWPMLRSVVATARAVAVHNPRVAAELREHFPGARIDTVRMGVGEAPTKSSGNGSAHATRDRLALPHDAIVFAAFGKVTAEKRIGAMLRALATVTAEGANAYLVVVGDTDDYRTLAHDLSRFGVTDRVRVTGYVPDHAIGDYLQVADVCLCLRWPTAQETSASWLRCLAARRPTAISDLAHLVDVPPQVALRIDLLDEEHQLARAMHDLAANPRLRADLAEAGHQYWASHHTLPLMAEDYRRVLQQTARCPAPAPGGLPRHLTDDHMGRARSIAREFGVEVDLLKK